MAHKSQQSKDQVRFQLIDQPFKMGRDLYILKGDAVAMPLTMKVQDPTFVIDQPTMHIPYQEDGALQSLMDVLWEQGFRPRSGTSFEYESIKSHLEDMRTIVGKILKLDWPKGGK